MTKQKEGFMTAEAAVMFPFLIFVTATLIYLMIFIYDSILIHQDINSLVSSIKCSKGDFYYTYREIKEEHPYISTSEPDIELVKRGGTYSITISCRWIFPLASNSDRLIKVSRDIKVLNPFEIMLYTEDILNMMSGGNNDSNENNQ